MVAIFLSIINTTLVQVEGERGERNRIIHFFLLRFACLKLRRFQNKAPLVKRGDIENAERREEKGKPMNNEC